MNKEVAINRITKVLETPIQYLRTENVIKREFNRAEFVSIIKDYSGEEYETINDLWDLALMNEDELKHQLIRIRTKLTTKTQDNKFLLK